MTYMVASSINTQFVDKRKLGVTGTDVDVNRVEGPSIFTANASGSTTTIVGANADLAAGTNVVRKGDKFKIHSSGGSLKAERVHRITGIAVSASTTITFSPAASVATASGDFIKLVGQESMDDISDLDNRLTTIAPSTYTAAVLAAMTVNDKIFALRTIDDPSGL